MSEPTTEVAGNENEDLESEESEYELLWALWKKKVSMTMPVN